MLLESTKNFRPPIHTRIKRSSETYRATIEHYCEELAIHVAKYKTVVNNEQKLRLIRDDIEHCLRRCHQYCIKQNIGAHYVEIGLTDNGIFEHMIPASTVRDMLIDGVITPIQSLNVPTCRLSKEHDNLLREKGWVSKTPDIYNFWLRYSYCFDTVGIFQTWDGQPVNTSITLDDHFKRFIDNTV